MGFEIVMAVILTVFAAAMAGAYFATKSMVIPNRISSLICPFYRMGIVIYRIKGKGDGKLGRSESRQKEQMMIKQFMALDPAVPGEQQLMEFQIERMAKCLLCIVAGAGLSLAVSAAGIMSDVIGEDGSIQRREFGQGQIQADLTVVSEEQDQKEEITLIVEERAYTREETEELFRQADRQIEHSMLGENDSFAHVTKPLVLSAGEEGFPFTIAWESSAYDLIDADGAVYNDELGEPVPVTLTASFKYRDHQFYSTKNVVVYPPVYSPEEQFSKSVSKELERENENSAEKQVLMLPKKLPSGESLDWQETKSTDGLLIFFLAALATVFVYISHEKEVENRVKEREKELIMAYPELIGKLTLYMGAGMTIRNVFMRLGEEYSRKKGRRKQYLYEEIVLTCRELQMGVSETDAYEHFGRRCKLRQYVRLTALLTQNLKKGSSNLAGMLQQESRDAFEYRKSMARKLGEEAGTKLLGPMVMMLCVVMVIIMIPAYLSFGM